MKLLKILPLLFCFLFVNGWAQEKADIHGKHVPKWLSEQRARDAFSLGLTPNTKMQSDSNTTLIGQWLHGPCYTSFVVGTYAYMGEGHAMDILDISNPADPVLVGRLMTLGTVEAIFVSGSYAYVAYGEKGLRIIDVSNPTVPQEV